MKKALVLTLPVFFCLLTTVSLAIAVESQDCPNETIRVDSIIDDYLNGRTENVLSEKNERLFQQFLSNFENDTDYIVTGVDNYNCVLKRNTEGEETINYVYEWKMISYSSLDTTNADIMGVGIRHVISINRDGEVVGDVCENILDWEDDTFIAFYNDFEDTSVSIAEFVNEILNKDYVERVRDQYDVNEVVAYADYFCGVPFLNRVEGTANPGNNTAYYNSAYHTYTPNADCANFVSQCLRAGGLSEDSTWYRYEVGGVYYGSYAWINALQLSNYLTGKGYSKVLATSSTCFAGNPVYWLNPSGSSSSGHQMICVGKNVSGVPIVNGHNYDMYHVPINFSDIACHTLYTNQIVSMCQHAGPYSSTTTMHWKVCKFCHTQYATDVHSSAIYHSDDNYHWKECDLCHRQFSVSGHTISSNYYYDQSSHWKVCTVCGKKANMTGHNYIYSGSVKTCRFCGYTTNDPMKGYDYATKQ